jgi:hypothetical protein
MTQETFDKAIELYKRLNDLHSAREMLKNCECHLIYKEQGDSTIFVIPAIQDITQRHDKMIRQEIDDEIQRINKEIEQL